MRMKAKVLSLYPYLLSGLIFAGCLASRSTNSNKVFRTGVNMLYGDISRQELFEEYPNWKERYDDYVPDALYMDSLSQKYPAVSIEIFLGTWCGDSRREVPRFLRITDASNIVAADSIRIWAVDRDKHLESGLAREKNIERVATFVFLKQGKEIGRITERPVGDSLEEDILEIMHKL